MAAAHINQYKIENQVSIAKSRDSDPYSAVKNMNIINLALAVILPPVGVYLTYGVGTTLFINIGLTLLGWIPGSIHAVWAIVKQAEINNDSVYK